MKLRKHGRYDYSPIVERPVYDWPGGKRLAFYIGLNIEHFSFGEGAASSPAMAAASSDSVTHSTVKRGRMSAANE